MLVIETYMLLLGGVLSPHLFSIFIDDLVKYVNKASVGCRIHSICTAIFLYADDVILLAPSVFTLRSLVDICASELEFLDMAINVKKIGMFALRLKIQKCVL